MNLWRILARAGELYPASLAVVEGAERRDYAELRRRALAGAAGLAELGVGEGERVALLDRNSSATIEATFGVAALGAVLCPLNVRLAPRELAAILRDAEPRVWLVRRALLELAHGALAEGGPACTLVPIDGGPGSWEELCVGEAAREPLHREGGEPAQLYYTSGTTGRPKGVVLTHRNVAAHALAAIAELRLDEATVWGHLAPMFHLADAWATVAVTWVGGRHVVFPAFEPAAALAGMEREGVTLTNLVPTMLARLVEEAERAGPVPPSLALVLSGGAPITPALVRRTVRVLDCEYRQTYGLTETSPYLTISALSRELAALSEDEQLAWRVKTGRPFLGVELEVVGEDDRPVARDGRAVGEVRARGDSVTPGYWRRPEETAAAIRDGWLYTGDLAVVDGAGYLTIVDRRKDVVLTGGETVYSTEVENALCEHPAVLEAAVFGVPHPEWGEALEAAVVLRAGGTAGPAELLAHCRERLAGYKCPKRITLEGELPRTGSGKVRKETLRERARAARP